MCGDLKDVMNVVKHQILESSDSSYSKQYQEDLLYDFEQARTNILQWKAHILRSANQDKAKQDIITNRGVTVSVCAVDETKKNLKVNNIDG